MTFVPGHTDLLFMWVIDVNLRLLVFTLIHGGLYISIIPLHLK